MPHERGEAPAGCFLGLKKRSDDGIVAAEFTRGFVMLTALWLVLGALVGAKVVLSRRNRRARNELTQALEGQIYRLQRVVAMAKEDEAFRELRARARGER